MPAPPPPQDDDAAVAAGAGAYDFIVVGLGASGSAALYQLAKRGHRVLGLEAQAAPASSAGSSHGGSRIIRLAYQEHPSYVAWLRRSYELWAELEAEAGEPLLRRTGCLNASAPGGAAAHGHSCFDGALASAREHALPHEVLGSEEAGRRFPALALPPGSRVLFDPAGGVLNPERAVRATVAAARRQGAHVLCGAPVQGWHAAPPPGGGAAAAATGAGVSVRTPLGTFTARGMVLAAGAWMPQLAPELAPLLQVERQVVGYFRPPPGSEPAFAALPVFLIDDGEGYYYGFPADADGLVKLGKYGHLRQVSSACDLDRGVHAADEAALRRCAERYFPALTAAPMERAEVCMFTNTPDGHFILARHPARPQVVLGSACSGHAFKFAPVLGEVLAELAEGGIEAAAADGGGEGAAAAALHGIHAGRKGHAAVLRRCGIAVSGECDDYTYFDVGRDGLPALLGPPLAAPSSLAPLSQARLGPAAAAGGLEEEMRFSGRGPRGVELPRSRAGASRSARL
jgi:sarcosine oxidase